MEKRIKTALFIEFLRGFAVVFAFSILAMSIAGTLIEKSGAQMNDVQMWEISTLFSLGNGLPYSTIFQLAGFSILISFFSMLLFSEHLQNKMRFLVRGLLLLFFTLITTSIFAVIFNWFPPNSLQTWIGFVLCTIICFVISFTLTLFKMKLEGKKYNKLLADYKTRHNNIKE